MTQEEKRLIGKAVAQINESVKNNIRIMEVCGTHTHQIARFGIRKLLTPKVRLVSGPGCPICVTDPGYIDALIALLKHENVSVATFGDLLRVRSPSGSLEEQKSLTKGYYGLFAGRHPGFSEKKHRPEYCIRSGWLRNDSPSLCVADSGSAGGKNPKFIPSDIAEADGTGNPLHLGRSWSTCRRNALSGACCRDYRYRTLSACHR